MSSIQGRGTGKIKQSDVPGIGQLNSIAEQILKEIAPLRKELESQTLEALKTGGVGAQIPIIQRAVENSRAATGGAINATTSNLSEAGLAGTPFGQGILAGTRTQGDVATSNIPTNMAAQFISGAPGLINQQQGQGINALSGGTSLDLQRIVTNVDSMRNFYNSLQNAIGGAFGSGSGQSGGSGIQVGTGGGVQQQSAPTSSTPSYSGMPLFEDTSGGSAGGSSSIFGGSFGGY